MNATTKASKGGKAMERGEVVKALGCADKSLWAWCKALGVLAVCPRCCGNGKFGPQSVDGGRCFGCGGAGRTMPGFTPALVESIKARVAAGELEPHRARWRAIAAAKRAIGPLKAEIDAAWKWSVAHQCSRNNGNHLESDLDLFTLDERGREVMASGLWRAIAMVNGAWDHANRVESAAAAGRMGAVEALAELELVRETLRLCDETLLGMSFAALALVPVIR